MAYQGRLTYAQYEWGDKHMKKFMDEFKAFAMKGNMLDLAVGVIVGGAFGKIISSLVNDMFMPVLGLLTGGKSVGNLFIQLGKSDTAYATYQLANEAGVSTLNYGMFIQTVIDFLIVAFFIFLFVKAISKLQKKKEAAPAPIVRKCDYCLEPVADAATRCPHCTSELKAKGKA